MIVNVYEEELYPVYGIGEVYGPEGTFKTANMINLSNAEYSRIRLAEEEWHKCQEMIKNRWDDEQKEAQKKREEEWERKRKPI